MHAVVTLHDAGKLISRLIGSFYFQVDDHSLDTYLKGLNMLIDLYEKGYDDFTIYNESSCGELEIYLVYLITIWIKKNKLERIEPNPSEYLYGLSARCLDSAEAEMRDTYNITRHHVERKFFTFFLPLIDWTQQPIRFRDSPTNQRATRQYKLKSAMSVKSLSSGADKMQDFTFSPENFQTRKEELKLGGVKTFKLNNGYMIPILANDYHHVCMETPVFFSHGVKQSKVINPKDPNLFVICSKDVCEWLETFYDNFWKWAYPLVLNAIQAYANAEKAQNRTVPESMTNMMEAGPLAMNNYVKDAWSGKDAFFLKVLTYALVYTQQPSSNFLNGRTAVEFAVDEKTVKRGNYKAHVVLRHIYVSKDDSGNLKVQLSMHADQLYCITEDYPCPMEPVMKTEMFSMTNDPVTDFIDNLALEYDQPQESQSQSIVPGSQPNAKKRKKAMNSETHVKKTKTSN